MLRNYLWEKVDIWTLYEILSTSILCRVMFSRKPQLSRNKHFSLWSRPTTLQSTWNNDFVPKIYTIIKNRIFFGIFFVYSFTFTFSPLMYSPLISVHLHLSIRIIHSSTSVLSHFQKAYSSYPSRRFFLQTVSYLVPSNASCTSGKIKNHTELGLVIRWMFQHSGSYAWPEMSH